MLNYKIILLAVCLPLYGMAQRDCSFSLSGKVFNAESKESMPFANVYVNELNTGVVVDSAGKFNIKTLCPGIYTVVCSYIGYKTITYTCTIDKNIIHNFFLEPEAVNMNEVLVEGKRELEHGLTAQLKTEIKGEDLLKTRGTTLGESLANVAGVYTLQSGPSIFKPVIHGLHSNRILIFNNGVRQEGQQWGSEHAPEIDPFVATKLSVIKGASSVRYGSDAMGGVIVVEPSSLPQRPGVNGELNLVGASNNRMGVTSGILQGAFNKRLRGLSWRIQGTFRRAGNSKTPHYYIENTGFEETNFSTAFGYKKKSYGVEVYYSEFNTKLGIFTGTHADAITDIQAAIQRSEPNTPSYFSYKIARPYQHVNHSLIKANAFLIFNNKSRIDVVCARQQNERSEYDYVPLSGKQNPELYLRLISHTVDIIYKHKSVQNYSGTLGFNGITQGNVRRYEMLIPNFRNYSGGLFYLGKLTKDRLTLEAGLRYDYRWLRVYTLDNNTAQVITPTWTFQNITETLGAQYFITPQLSWAIDMGTAWRAPSVNELMSQGVHQSAAAYEIGNANLHTEKAYNFNTSFHFQGRRWHGEIGFYNNVIDGYIYLKPDLQFVHTIRGSYPTFTYTQVNALFRGVDFSATYSVVDSLSFTSKISILYAWNKTTQDYLQLIPANRFENTWRYGLGDFGFCKKLYFSITNVSIAKQNRVPANSDYAVPPPGYMLFHASLGASILVSKQLININFSVNNVLNTTYRDYMDRFRYFTDEPGRNFTLRLRVPLALLNEIESTNE